MTFRPAARILAITLWALISAPSIAVAHHSIQIYQSVNEAIGAVTPQNTRKNMEIRLERTSSGLLERASRNALIPETEDVA